MKNQNLQILPIFNLLKKGVEEGIYPGAIAGIWYKEKRYIIITGYKSITPFLEPLEDDDIFDLASLTKPLAFVFTLIFLLSQDPKIDLQKPLKTYLPFKKPIGEIPVYRFLNHTSGLKAWYPFYKEKRILKLENVVKKIEELPLEYKPGTKSIYSDLGFYLFTYLIEKIYEESFENLFEKAKRIVSFTKKAFLGFCPLKRGIDQEKIVPTSVCPWSNKILRGVVEDENTRALGGISGVAGLFGNIYGVLDILETIFFAYKKEIKGLSQDLLRYFINFKENISDFCLGFMFPSFKGYSATGGVFSKNTIGHLGFTGCSFFMDLEKDLIVVLLTNRVHPNRNNRKIKDFRPKFHKTVVENLKII